MNSIDERPIQRRRRGPRLEAQLLEATWGLLLEMGFSNLTMELVAARAHTGIAVLYRRWANKDQLVTAAFEHYRDTHPIDIPDTGNLRDDLLAALASVNQTRATFFALVSASAFSGLQLGASQNPAEVREQFLGNQSSPLALTIYERARIRGEVESDRIPESVLALPFDLLRHDMFMQLKPVAPARIFAIVDEVFLPLLRLYQG